MTEGLTITKKVHFKGNVPEVGGNLGELPPSPGC